MRYPAVDLRTSLMSFQNLLTVPFVTALFVASPDSIAVASLSAVFLTALLMS